MRATGVVALAFALPILLVAFLGAGDGSVDSPSLINQVLDNRYPDERVVDYVAAHPNTVTVQQLSGHDLGEPRWAETRAKFASIRAEAASRTPRVAVRLCSDARPDIYRRSTATPETFGGLTWSDDWLLRVPAQTHQTDLSAWTGGRMCAGPSPFWNVAWFNAALGGSEDWCHNRGTPGNGSVPIVYGVGEDGCTNPGTSNAGCTNRFLAVGFLAVDLRNPQWRTFSVRRTIAQLTLLGDHPGGDPTWVPECILVGYKPGWWMRHDAGSRGACWTSDGHSHFGYARPGFAGGYSCRTGPLDATPYGKGEFEAALNSWAHELDAALTAKGGPYASVRIVTQEAPRGSDPVWYWMDSTTRASGRFRAEMRGVVSP